VAEPVIQPAGGNRILIQLPGLSPSDKASAKEQIQKAAYLEFRMVKDDSDEIIANHRSRFRRAMCCSSTLTQDDKPPA
jgi:preprotein translocase subunit SecD